ncbi:hypothetical protein FOZ62_015783, partial [Perkinsus olseni]
FSMVSRLALTGSIQIKASWLLVTLVNQRALLSCPVYGPLLLSFSCVSNVHSTSLKAMMIVLLVGVRWTILIRGIRPCGYGAFIIWLIIGRHTRGVSQARILHGLLRMSVRSAGKAQPRRQNNSLTRVKYMTSYKEHTWALSLSPRTVGTS